MNLRNAFATVFLSVTALIAAAPAQRVAVLVPESSPFAGLYAKSLSDALEKHFRVLELSQSDAAYRSFKIEQPFNLFASDARRIGEVVGCDHFILLRTDTSKRSSSARPAYHEASAFLFLVNARSGSLEKFLLASKQADAAKEAEADLSKDASSAADWLAAAIRFGPSTDLRPEFEVFDTDSKTMRPAMPYKRIKPEYTDAAFLHDVKATVDAEVSIDEKGGVKKIDIVRWAGFGLDEAVIDAVNKMNWRPGERAGKPFPMRVLLRYNFTKIEKEP